MVFWLADVPGEQVGDAVDGVVGDAGEHVAEPGFRVEAVELGGFDLGAENLAVLASLIETCKLHNVNPEAWLADVLTRLVNGWPNRRLAELTPWTWKAARNTLDRVAA